MYISGYGLNTSYYSYLYNSSANKVGLTSDSLNPVGDVLTSKLQSTQGVQKTYTPPIPGSDSTAFQDIMTLQYKLLKEQEYDEALEDARINDPQKYEDMQAQREQDIAKSFRQVEEIARKSGDGKTGMATYNGVPIAFDFQNGIMTVGDMSAGNDIINVGKLPNGYAFSFNRDNIGDISKILDLFSPEDINKIMEVITTDNIAKSMEQEIEDEKAKIGKSGIGFSVYYMNRANNAYEDSFVYAR